MQVNNGTYLLKLLSGLREAMHGKHLALIRGSLSRLITTTLRPARSDAGLQMGTFRPSESSVRREELFLPGEFGKALKYLFPKVLKTLDSLPSPNIVSNRI